MTRRFLLDSGPAFEYIFRRRGVYERARDTRRTGAKVGIGVPVLGEIIGGIEASTSRDQNWDVVKHGLKTLILWPFDKDAAYNYGRLFSELRRVGRTMQQIDIQIGAIALSLGSCVVLTTDSDLAAIPGLTVENWTRP